MEQVRVLPPAGSISGRHLAGDPAGGRAEGTLADLWGSARRGWLWIVAGALIAGCLGGLFVLRQTPSYRASVEILIDPQALQIVGRGLSRTDTPAQLDFANLESQSLILLSAKVLERVVARLDLADDPVLTRGAKPGIDRAGFALEALRKRLIVRRVETSLIFQLSAIYPEPRRAAEIANAVAAAYFDVAAGDRLAAVRRANETLLSQLNDLRGQLDRADLAVERYRADKGLIGSGESGLLVSQQLRDLYGQITTAEAELARLSGRREKARAWAAADGPPATPEAGASAVMISLRAQHAQSTQEIAQLSRSLGQNHPQMLALAAQRAATVRLIASEADRIRRTIDEDVRRGEEGLRLLRRRAEALVTSQTSSNEEGIRLRQLESEAEAIRRTYNLVLGRSKDLEQQEVINPNNSQIVSRAVPPLKPSDTPMPIVAAAGALLGAVLGLAAAYLFDRWRGTFATAASLAASGVPVWARLPRAGRADADQALVAAARELRDRLAAWPGATITVASEGLGAERLRTAHVLTELLIRLGEPAILVPGTLRPQRALTEPGAGRAAPRRAVSRHSPAARTELVVTERDLTDGESWLAIPETSDAIVLVVAPGRTTRARLARLIEILDGPGGFRHGGLIGLVAVQPSRPVRRAVPRGAAVAVRPA
ncbi:GumC family protein [Methylobacterium radiodurans]|uniref:GumC family protein n=1 Tax=Methylobacterium radiodurans TaxID=2202828 RepID=UPI0013A555D4|nr:GumC family protein [Methylobacterium radiodurans]